MSTLEAIVESLDPDWRDHFICVDDAAEHYQQYSPKEWREAYTEITGDDWDAL